MQLCLKDAEFLRQFSFRMLVVDEAHRLKNRSSLLHQTLLQVRCYAVCSLCTVWSAVYVANLAQNPENSLKKRTETAVTYT